MEDISKNLDVRSSAINFEAVKISMSQDKNGVVLRLSIHPQECPPQLHSDWVGSRYVVAMVKLADDDTPELREEEIYIERMISSAGLLCRNEEFYGFLLENDMVSFSSDAEKMEKECANAVRRYCNIKSRGDLRTNVEARRKFEALRGTFMEWKKRSS